MTSSPPLLDAPRGGQMQAPATAHPTPEPVAAAARRIAREVAARHAETVDREARFPAEAVQAMRKAGLLGAAVPCALGGRGAGTSELAAACYELGQGCGSAGMVFAMHQIQVLCLVRHGQASPWHRDFLARLVRDGLLLASATTEAGIGGDTRRSGCAVLPGRAGLSLEKDGCVISYADTCDAVLVTARRDTDAPPSDQVLVVVERPQWVMEGRGVWDTLGMRGTCSESRRLTAEFGPEQILPLAYAGISAQTMVPVSHILWSALWLGIATAAIDRARASFRARSGRGPATGSPSLGALRLAGALAQLRSMRALVTDAVRRYEAALGDPNRLASIQSGMAMNQLKVAASTILVEIVGQAMLVGGLDAYRNDTPFSLGRHLRDAHSAALMVSNDRILSNGAALLALYRADEPLFT